jgi:hypothetical protein
MASNVAHPTSKKPWPWRWPNVARMPASLSTGSLLPLQTRRAGPWLGELCPGGRGRRTYCKRWACATESGGCHSGIGRLQVDPSDQGKVTRWDAQGPLCQLVMATGYNKTVLGVVQWDKILA